MRFSLSSLQKAAARFGLARRPYQLPQRSVVSPWQGWSEEEVRSRLAAGASGEEVYHAFSHDASHDWVIASSASAAQLTEELLWEIVADRTRVSVALEHNAAFSTDHLAMLLARAREDLMRLEQGWRARRRSSATLEGSEARLRSLQEFLEEEQVPEMRAEHPALVGLQEVVARPAPEGLARVCALGLARGLLRQESVPFSEEQLARLGTAFAQDMGMMRRILERARSGEPALALYEALDASGRRLWAEAVAQSPGALTERRVIILARQFVHGSHRLLLLMGELQHQSPLEYGYALQRLWRESAPLAREAVQKYPPPEGTRLPKELVAEMLAGGSAQERLALIRVVGSLATLAQPSPLPPGEEGEPPHAVPVTASVQAPVSPGGRGRGR